MGGCFFVNAHLPALTPKLLALWLPFTIFRVQERWFNRRCYQPAGHSPAQPPQAAMPSQASAAEPPAQTLPFSTDPPAWATLAWVQSSGSASPSPTPACSDQDVFLPEPASAGLDKPHVLMVRRWAWGGSATQQVREPLLLSRNNSPQQPQRVGSSHFRYVCVLKFENFRRIVSLLRAFCISVMLLHRCCSNLDATVLPSCLSAPAPSK